MYIYWLSSINFLLLLRKVKLFSNNKNVRTTKLANMKNKLIGLWDMSLMKKFVFVSSLLLLQTKLE